MQDNKGPSQHGFVKHGSYWTNLISFYDKMTRLEDEGKAEVLNVFFALVFNSQTSHPQGTQPPELEDRDEEQNEVPIVQGETCCST